MFYREVRRRDYIDSRRKKESGYGKIDCEKKDGDRGEFDLHKSILL
jgi:hypothetical protein